MKPEKELTARQAIELWETEKQDQSNAAQPSCDQVRDEVDGRYTHASAKREAKLVEALQEAGVVFSSSENG